MDDGKKNEEEELPMLQRTERDDDVSQTTPPRGGDQLLFVVTNLQYGIANICMHMGSTIFKEDYIYIKTRAAEHLITSSTRGLLKILSIFKFHFVYIESEMCSYQEGDNMSSKTIHRFQPIRERDTMHICIWNVAKT